MISTNTCETAKLSINVPLEWRSLDSFKVYSLHASFAVCLVLSSAGDCRFHGASVQVTLPTRASIYWVIKGTHVWVLGGWCQAKKIRLSSLFLAFGSICMNEKKEKSYLSVSSIKRLKHTCQSAPTDPFLPSNTIRKMSCLLKKVGFRL